MKLSTIFETGLIAFNIALIVTIVRAHPETFGLAPTEANTPGYVATAETHPELFEPENTKGLAKNTSALTRSPETQSYILDTIRANPQAVVDALEAYQAQIAQEKRQALLSAPKGGLTPAKEEPIIAPTPDRADVEAPVFIDPEDTDNAHVSGNPNGDITVVEFFDYNCGHCRSTTPILSDVVASDGNIRVIYREFPILGQESVFAARASLAARTQGLYEEFHKEMMGYGALLDESAVMEIAINVGLDPEQLREDMASPMVLDHIKRTLDLAGQYDFKGTPSFVIGGVAAPGAPTKEELEDFIAGIRSR